MSLLFTGLKFYRRIVKAVKVQSIAVVLFKNMHFPDFCLIVGFVTIGIGHMPFRLQVFNGSLFVFLVLSLAQLQTTVYLRQGILHHHLQSVELCGIGGVPDCHLHIVDAHAREPFCQLASGHSGF